MPKPALKPARAVDRSSLREDGSSIATSAAAKKNATAANPKAYGWPLSRGCSMKWLVDQPVELARIGAGDHLGHLGRYLGELLLDVLVGVGPHAVAVRVVGAPHQALGTHVVDQLGADAVELEGSLALAAPVVRRLHLQPEV